MQLIAINKMASYCSFTAIEHAGAREYRGTEVILIGCFGKNQSIKKVGGSQIDIQFSFMYPPVRC